jgi:hypothetical protein
MGGAPADASLALEAKSPAARIAAAAISAFLISLMSAKSMSMTY